MSLLASGQSGGVAVTGTSAGGLKWSQLLGQTLTAFGELYISSSSATTVSDDTSYFDVAGTWNLGEALLFDENTNGQLRYTGSATVRALVVASVSFTPSNANDLIHVRLEKSGANVAGSDATVSLKSTSEREDVSIVGLVSLATNDYLTLAVRNESAANNVTAVEGHMVALAFST